MNRPLSITDACRYQFSELVSRGSLVYEDAANAGPLKRQCWADSSVRLARGGMDLAGYCRCDDTATLSLCTTGPSR